MFNFQQAQIIYQEKISRAEKTNREAWKYNLEIEVTSPEKAISINSASETCVKETNCRQACAC